MAKTIKRIIALTLAFLCGAIACMSLMLVKDDLKDSVMPTEMSVDYAKVVF